MVRTLASLLFTALLAAAPSASADWWSKAKDAISSVGKDQATALSSSEIAAGLKEALTVGTKTVVQQLGQPGGFESDPAVHIPLPDSLDSVRSALDRVGMAGTLNELEVQLNRAAEVATPRAQEIFVDAITAMTLDDVQAIYRGPDDAATQYFRSKMSWPLAEAMSPVVQDSLAQVGAVQSYDRAMADYQKLPFMPDVTANLNTYVVERGMDGIFLYLAEQEAEIRRDPAKRSTELLQKVFGAAQ